jgi:hypothetical protein
MPRRRNSLLLVAVAALVGAFVVFPAGPASAGIGWITICPQDHDASEDPIVYPGQRGVSHLHQFQGAKDTNAFSTYASMRAGGTSCQQPADSAGYWIPAVYEDGVRVPLVGRDTSGDPIRQVFYYRAENVSSSYRQVHPVEPFPPGFKMIAGVSSATTTAQNPELGSEIYWGCSDNSTGKLKLPQSCATGAISLHVGFPNCWDGQMQDTNNAPAHLRYPSSGVCPTTHPRVLPRVIFRYELLVGTTTGKITLAMPGGMTDGTVNAIHGDFWNTWDQAALAHLVTNCMGTNKDCGNNPPTPGGTTPTPSPTPTVTPSVTRSVTPTPTHTAC